MPKKRLDQYKGRLDPKQVAQGINAARANAQKLADEAASLLKHGRHALAAALAALAIEEAGKVGILRSLALAETKQEAAEHWKKYRTHTKKSTMWPLPGILDKPSPRREEVLALFDRDADHAYRLDHMKQLGFYTDCLGEGEWSSPDVAISRSQAEELVRTAVDLANFPEVTDTEIELWVKQTRPVSKADAKAQGEALRAWHAEMPRLGLAPPGDNPIDELGRRLV